MTERLRWGILGTGWIAGEMTADLGVLGSPVTAVGSRAQDTADAFAARFGIPRWALARMVVNLVRDMETMHDRIAPGYDRYRQPRA